MKFSKIPILMYHEISNQDNPWCVSPNEFSNQMQFLRDNNYKTISLSKLNDGLKNNSETNEKLVIITFDDAREGVYNHALPVLKKFCFTATIYVVPGWVETDKIQIPLIENYSKFISWEKLNELAKAGFEIGSHTNSHNNLAKTNSNQLFDEIGNAEKMINEKLNINVKHFSYPYGEFNEEALNIVKQRYETAVTITRGFNKEQGKFSRQWILRDTTLNHFKNLLFSPKLSLCMVVKDEEKFLEECLNSVKNLADEIIIVDTGSSDKTKEIAKKFTAKIFDFAWCDDFSLARNDSLKHATGDWILVLDADEILHQDDLEKIKAEINNWSVSGYRLMTVNYTNDSSVSGWQPCGNNNSLVKSFSGWFPSLKVRLFQRNNEHLFTGAMHEMVDHSIEKSGGKIKNLLVPVHHYGELRNTEEKNIKKEKYLNLAEKKIEENPTNAKSYFELGIQYRNSGKLENAEEAFKNSLNLDKKPLMPLLNLAIVQQKQRKFDLAIKNFNTILEKNKSSFDAYFGLGFCYFILNDLDKSKENFQQAIEHNPSFLDAYVNLGAIMEKQGKFEEAVANYRKAIELDPRNARIYNNLGVVHEKMFNVPMAIKCYEKAIELNYTKKDTLIARVKRMNQFIVESSP